MPEVVITGVGMVTPLGATAAESAAAWREGRPTPCGPLAELAGTPLETAHAALLPPLDAPARLGRRTMKYMSEAAVLGSLAAREAAEQAGLSDRFAPARVGLFAAAGLASAAVEDFRPMIEASTDGSGAFSCALFGSRGLAATNPLLSFKLLANMPACLVSIAERVQGPSYIFTPWEGQAGAAFVEAWRAIESGEVDAALVGAADTAALPSTFVFLRQAGLLADREWPASGAAYLVFERADCARRDGRPALAYLVEPTLRPADAGVCDPLAPRLGRSFAAAPAILLALAAQSVAVESAIVGVDCQQFRFAVEAPR